MKPGIKLEVPGFGTLNLTMIVTDYSGTHSCYGKLSEGAHELLKQLSGVLDIHILTSDTFGTCRKVMEGLDVEIHILEGTAHDARKAKFVRERGAQSIAAFGNGNNDRQMLQVVKAAGGLAVAVDNGEGCAIDALINANLLVYGSVEALRLLVNTNSLKATLRF